MTALLTSLLLAVGLPVKPVSAVPELVGHGKPVVLHFWATWCDACREEFPALRPRLLSLPGRGVGVELISIDRPEDSAKAREMLGQYGLSALPALLIDAPDPDPVAQAVGDPKWDGTLPATFVFDARGKLLRGFIGRISPPAALDRAVRKLRAAPRPRGPPG